MRCVMPARPLFCTLNTAEDPMVLTWLQVYWIIGWRFPQDLALWRNLRLPCRQEEPHWEAQAAV